VFVIFERIAGKPAASTGSARRPLASFRARTAKPRIVAVKFRFLSRWHCAVLCGCVVPQSAQSRTKRKGRGCRPFVFSFKTTYARKRPERLAQAHPRGGGVFLALCLWDRGSGLGLSKHCILNHRVCGGLPSSRVNFFAVRVFVSSKPLARTFRILPRGRVIILKCHGRNASSMIRFTRRYRQVPWWPQKTLNPPAPPLA